MTLILMYDSVDVSTVPNNPQAVAGYVGGYWPTYSPLVKKFPKALHKSVCVSADEDGDILDIENGDAVPSQAPAWVRRQQARGLKLPGLYANASTMPDVIAAIQGAGIKREEVVIWIAHYTYSEPREPLEQGADAVQFTDHELNRNLDASVCTPHFFGEAHRLPAINKVHYERFTGVYPSKWGPLDERLVVERYDGARKHWIRYCVYLRKLRQQLAFLADRVYKEANKEKNPDGKPSWNKFHRGYRYQQLMHRAHGQRFV